MRVTQLTLLIALFGASLALPPSSSAVTPTAAGWVVILNEKPVVERYPGRIEKMRAAAEPYRRHLRQAQANLRPQIEGMHVRVTGSVQHLLNGMFVRATPAQAAALAKLPGVKSVMRMRRYHKAALDQNTLSSVATAWTEVGGESNAGAGMKIGIIDTGIDQSHPAFNDSGFTKPSGYPICPVQSDCEFTNNKVIVARSYVSDIVYSDVSPTAPDLAAQSRPDDLSARDLDGHGTAVAAVAAAVTTTYNGIQITGVAPRAFLGNYKVFGSDDVNPNGSGNILQALEDAVTDGMDVVNLSLGSPAYGGPLDIGCSSNTLPNNPIPIPIDACDPLAYEVENAMQGAHVVVVVAAGNQGSNGYQFNYGCGAPPCYNLPTFGTVGSPADAPSAIAVGGIQNGVTYVQRVEITGSNVPQNLHTIDAFASFDGPVPAQPLTAPLKDATQAGDSDGLLCNPVGQTALAGRIVLVLSGSCADSIKVINAQDAGAVGVLEIANASSFFLPSGLAGTTIPTFIIGGADGSSLKNLVDANSGVQATLDPRPYQMSADSVGLPLYSIAPFSSRGPVAATGALKPDVVAAATDFLLPAETYDPNGILFNFSGYAVTQGTSFSAPMVTGSAALVKQANPTLSPLQIKSALVNTASLFNPQLVTADNSAGASISETGAGLLQTQNAVVSTVQVVPSSVSFGLVGTSLPAAQTLTFYNTRSSQVNLTMNVVPGAGHSTSATQVLVNNSSAPTVTVPGNGSVNVSVSLSGSQPPAGRYEGVITASGGPVPLTIPYMFARGDGVPYDLVPLNAIEPGQGFPAFDGAVGAEIPWYPVCDNTNNSCVNDYGPVAIQVLDQYGVPVVGAAVAWAATQGGGSVVQDASSTDSVTNANGLAGATVILGPSEGSQEFTATVNGMVLPFDGYARVPPVINAGGVVDAASYSTRVAPGSWISVFGTNLTDTTQGNSGTNNAFANCPPCNPATGQPFPMGIDGAAFSFDTANQSVAGRFSFVSPTQVNIQVPWELEGETSATVKVIVNYTYSGEYSLQLSRYAPSFFAIDAAGDAAALHRDYSLVTTGAPVARGDAVLLFLNGLGPVSIPQTDGVAAPGLNGTNLATTTANPLITIGGQTADLLFSGLAPGSVSLYQVNVTVPSGISAGVQPVTCTIGGVTSKTAYLPVQ